MIVRRTTAISLCVRVSESGVEVEVEVDGDGDGDVREGESQGGRCAVRQSGRVTMDCQSVIHT